MSGPGRLPARWLPLLIVLAVAGCAVRPPTPPAPPAPPPAPVPAAPVVPSPVTGPADRGAVPATPAPRPTDPAQAAAAGPGRALGPAPRARHWNEFKRLAAQRMMAANPTLTYDGPVPDPLLAIPVLEVELNADGSVRRIEVLRQPSQARDTTQLAIDAVRRAAPFGDVSHLPRPWKFVEVFLFDDRRRFKPRTLDD